MYVRCVYFEGDVAPADREKFDRCVIDEVAPQMAKFPGCREVRVLRGREYEDGAPNFYIVLEHYYDNQDDIGKALASENRAAVRDHLSKVMPLFKGRVTHINYEVDLTAAGS